MTRSPRARRPRASVIALLTGRLGLRAGSRSLASGPRPPLRSGCWSFPPAPQGDRSVPRRRRARSRPSGRHRAPRAGLPRPTRLLSLLVRPSRAAAVRSRHGVGRRPQVASPSANPRHRRRLKVRPCRSRPRLPRRKRRRRLPRRRARRRLPAAAGRPAPSTSASSAECGGSGHPDATWLYQA